jgi:hypothetical protein
MLHADHVDSSTNNEGVHCQNSYKCGEILKEITGMGKGWVYGPLIGSNDQRTNFDRVCL